MGTNVNERTIEVILPNQIGYERIAMASSASFAKLLGFSPARIEDLKTVVAEAAVNAMQHGMIYVGAAIMPAANEPEAMNSVAGPGPNAHNRAGSFVGPMAASFQVDPPAAPPRGDLESAEAYGRRVAEITLQFVRGRA